MDTNDDRSRRPAMGGTLEPAKRVTPNGEGRKASIVLPGERYELRDPMAEITYRSSLFDEIVNKAGLLGIDRFVAIDADARRTTVQLVNGVWERGPQRSPAPERPLDPVQDRDDLPDVPTREAASRSSTAPSITPPAHGEPANPRGAEERLDTRAERAAVVARIEAALLERYLIRRAPVTVGDVTIGTTEYRFRGDTSRIAFTESTFRLATDTNSPSVARSMVDVAQARNWHSLRVSGNEDFRRMVWLEASARGVRIQGYEPNPGDIVMLKREREARQVNRVEPDKPGSRDPAAQASATEKGTSGRGGGGRKTVLAAIEAVLVAKQVPESKRTAIMLAATEQLNQRLRDGQMPRVKVYDPSAPSQREVAEPTRQAQRTRERAAPVR